MQIVDARIHLWGSGLPGNLAHRRVTACTTAQAVALMDECGVDAAVIHPPGWGPEFDRGAFSAVRGFPGRFAIMGSLPLERTESRSLVARWTDQPAMHTYLRQAIDAYGPQRMFRGTGITKMPVSWRQCVTMFTEELPWLSETDQRRVTGQALCAWSGS